MRHRKFAYISTYQDKVPGSPYINLLRILFENRLWSIRGQKSQLNKTSALNKYIFRPGESYIFWNHITKTNFNRSFMPMPAVKTDRVRLRSFFEKLVKLQGREKLTFKITGPTRLAYLDSIFPDAEYVLIKRNPLDNIKSLLQVKFYADRKDKIWWDSENIYSEDEKLFMEKHKKSEFGVASLQYYKIHEIYEKEKKSLGLEDRILEVNYEDFIKDPKEIVSKILQRVGYEIDDSVEEYLESLKIYNRNRKDNFFGSPEIEKEVIDISINGVKNTQL